MEPRPLPRLQSLLSSDYQASLAWASGCSGIGTIFDEGEITTGATLGATTENGI